MSSTTTETSTPVFEIATPVRTTAGGATAMVELQLTLAAPTDRVAIRAPDGGLGRAEAIFGKHNWAAKHHWTEGEPGQQVTTFAFDEPLPAGPLILRIPVHATE